VTASTFPSWWWVSVVLAGARRPIQSLPVGLFAITGAASIAFRASRDPVYGLDGTEYLVLSLGLTTSAPFLVASCLHSL